MVRYKVFSLQTEGTHFSADDYFNKTFWNSNHNANFYVLYVKNHYGYDIYSNMTFYFTLTVMILKCVPYFGCSTEFFESWIR